MAELEADFQELIAILRKARVAVREEIELLQGQETDNEAYQRLLTAVRSFGDQAQSLFVIMVDRGADEASWREASDLAALFRAIEDLIQKVLALNKA